MQNETTQHWACLLQLLFQQRLLVSMFTEVMAQIGVVCLGIFLFEGEISNGAIPQIALVSSAIDFYLPVLPGEKVHVKSEKEYFRFNKLKCAVQMFNKMDQLVCRGTIAGMIK